MSIGVPPRRLLALLYLAGLVILADQIAELAATVLLQPATTGAASWRFAVFGIATSRATVFLIADVLLFAAAAGLEHRGILRLLGVGHLVLAAALGVGLGLFGLDALEVQRVVRPAGRNAFLAASTRAAAVALSGMILLFWAGVVALRISRAPSRKGTSQRDTLLMPTARNQ
jgi:hypothetical protein